MCVYVTVIELMIVVIFTFMRDRLCVGVSTCNFSFGKVETEGFQKLGLAWITW